MNETITVAVTTQIFGLGGGQPAAPTIVVLPTRTLSARTLIAEHVRAEVQHAHHRRAASLALHYLLADNVRAPGETSTGTPIDADAEIRRAWRGLLDRRYMLVVDGMAVDELDTALCIAEHSRVNFVRLLPLVGG